MTKGATHSFVDKLGKEDKTDDDLVFIFVCSEPAISSERAIS